MLKYYVHNIVHTICRGEVQWQQDDQPPKHIVLMITHMANFFDSKEGVQS